MRKTTMIYRKKETGKKLHLLYMGHIALLKRRSPAGREKTQRNRVWLLSTQKRKITLVKRGTDVQEKSHRKKLQQKRGRGQGKKTQRTQPLWNPNTSKHEGKRALPQLKGFIHLTENQPKEEKKGGCQKKGGGGH